MKLHQNCCLSPARRSSLRCTYSEDPKHYVTLLAHFNENERDLSTFNFLVFSTSSLVVSIRYCPLFLYFVLLRNYLSSLFRINRT